jgi:hypothetical protein
MHSTLTPKPSDDPHDVVVVAPDAVRVAPSDEELSNLLHQAARYRSETQTPMEPGAAAAPAVRPVDTTFRPASVNNASGSGTGPSIGRRVGRAFTALLLAACIGGAAMAWQAFGYAGKKMIVKWTPQFILTSLPLEKWGLSAPSNPPAVETVAANAAPSPSAAEGVAANAAAPSADSPQSMARDLANVSQEVEQLRASIEQLKAGQQQISRDVAKVSEQKASEQRASEQNARAKISALPPRPPVVRPRKPVTPYPPTPTAAASAPPQATAPYVPRQVEPLPQPPQAEAQLPPAPGFTSVPRPPMPLQ